MNTLENSGNIYTSFDTQQLQAIFETAIDCLIIIDGHGIINKINPAGATLFGYEVNELLGKNVNTLMPSPHHERHDGYIENHQKTGKAKIIGIGRDVQAKKKDGSLFPCRLSVNEFSMRNVPYYAGILHDLTNRKAAEEQIMELNKKLKEKIKLTSNDLSEVVNELLESNKKLEKEIVERKRIEEALRESEHEIRNALEKEKELNDLKSRFVSMASHEFRTPLSTIQSSTSIIEKYVDKGEGKKAEKHFSRIQSSVKNLTDILNDFLSISKLEEGKIENAPERFSLIDFLEVVKEEVSSLLKREQSIQTKFPEEDVEVLLDKKLIRNILFNLLSNAFKYSKEGQDVYFLAEVLAGQLILKIKDDGMGIPSREQKHLFERFFRGSNAVNIKGTGLGLNIVKQYVNMMDGSIYFESEEGMGTTFTIVLPLNV